ncbi:MAG: 3-dehydroquinate dehydratase [Campylobacterota bacterium]|nr:3-dehydroquinate dehydratase [Campylobacterota bacterium]
MRFSRGLAALIFIIFFQNILLADEYLYKDEVLHNPEFRQSINKLGGELFDKTGIKLRLVSIKKIEGYKTIFEYEKDLIKEFNEPTILLIFSELDMKVDIYVSDNSLYKYFDKEQVLSPAASPMQAVAIAVTNATSFETFMAMLGNYGGTILPLIGLKAKEETLGKYSAALYNGYADIAEQVANSKDGIVLENEAGNANKLAILALKTFFYGFIIYAIIQYIRRILYRRKHKNEFE